MAYGKTYAFSTESGEWKVTGLNANHDRASFPQHLLFERDGKRVLYATDGAWILNETYARLANADCTMLVLDATVGDYVGDYRVSEHNSLPMIRLMLPSLKKSGIISDETKIYLTHLAPSLHLSHAETEKIAKKEGWITAYDGLRVEM